MQIYRRITLTAFLIMGILSWLQPIASAQVYSGSITGLVTDETGAVIPNATVTLTDENKGFLFKAASGGDGVYVLRNLPPGVYRLVVVAPGMRKYERTGLDLEVGQNGSHSAGHFVANPGCFDGADGQSEVYQRPAVGGTIRVQPCPNLARSVSGSRKFVRPECQPG